MAVAFRALGARLKANTGGAKTISMPAGVVAADTLLMVITVDCRLDETVTSAGWTYLTTAGRYDQTAATPWPRTKFYWKTATGSEGASQSATFPTDAYPQGTPNILAYIIAWSGGHQTSPFVDVEPDDTTNPSITVDHPIINVSSANSWLISVRSVSATASRTFTISPGDTERVDDTDGFSELSVALYDTNATVSTGLHTLRQTTASGIPQYGNNMSTLALRPPTAAGSTQAAAGQAVASATAYDASVVTVEPDWDFCVTGATYTFGIDWNSDGDFNDPDENATADILSSGITIRYGRDQERQLSPTSIGSMAYDVNNSHRKYSPENASSPLFGSLDPAREANAEVNFSGLDYPLFRGRVDDYDVKADRKDRTASFTFLDGQALLQGAKLSTGVYTAIRSGAAVHAVLDAVNWTGPRDIDLGASFFPYWWVEGNDAFTALQEIVRSEGPPAIAYQTPDGTFTFRDRHHRIMREHSVNSQATFASAEMDCDSPPVTGFSYTSPFIYKHGWRDIINKASIEVGERSVADLPEQIWSSDSNIIVGTSETIEIQISAQDPFVDAQDLVSGTDILYTGAGVLTTSFNRRDGQSIILRITSVGGTATITFLQVRARPIPVQRTTKITQQDSTSISDHGERSYPDTVPWVNVHDALAVVSKVVFRYAQRKPIVELRIASSDPAHYHQVLTRTVSDRITVVNGEMGLSSDFFVEKVSHTIRRIWGDQAPVHAVVLGCEKEPETAPSNPFTFDKRGAGFDEGVFDPLSSDDPEAVFIFDHPIQGQFDLGVFAT